MINSVVPFKNRVIDLAKPVYLYRNLHLKERGYSIKQSGVVVGRVFNNFFLQHCEFIINKSEYKRYLKTGERNVHAMVKGFVTESCKNSFSYPLYYSLQEGCFYAGSEFILKNASCVYIDQNQIMVQI